MKPEPLELLNKVVKPDKSAILKFQWQIFAKNGWIIVRIIKLGFITSGSSSPLSSSENSSSMSDIMQSIFIRTYSTFHGVLKCLRRTGTRC